MYTPVYTHQFAKDVKRTERRGKNLEKFKIVAQTLLSGQRLDPIHRDHKLLGDYLGRRDCHIESDWILIYKVENNNLIFERMGTHSDIFKK
ncbi:MAG: damage-inducible protein [Lentisphaerae bacterium RIFOXYA12_FULL_48_11]|nr:MAG: damage-inducible protein [Lentisphaerae bacterium RIFOXYA12_FULL_48_11]